MQKDLKTLETLLRHNPQASMRAGLFWRDYEQLPAGMDFHLLYSAALKRLGKTVAVWQEEEALFLSGTFQPLFTEISLGKLARILLILKFATPEQVNEILLRGDDGERAAALHSLIYLENPDQYLEQAINCTRSNSEIVYQAVALNNAYAGRFFDNRQFFHLVLKCIFLNFNIEKIVGLRDRYTDEFGRMLLDFYNERTAAGRKLPDEVTEFMKEKALL